MPLMYVRGARAATEPKRIGQWFASVSTSSTLTIDYPVGSAPGDYILLLVSGARTATGTITFPPDGPTWTVLQSNNHGSNNLGAQVLWARRGAETSTTITMTPATSPSFLVALVTAYLGASVNATTPFGPSNTTSIVSTATAISSAALAGVAERAEVVALYWGWKSPSGTAWSTTWSGAGGAVKRAEEQAGGPSYQVLHAIGTAVQQAAGSFGVVTVTGSGSSVARGLTVVAVNPVA